MRLRVFAIWATILAVVTVPMILTVFSPLLAWRDPIYIGAGFAGVAAMALLLMQPLLAQGLLPNLTISSGRQLHRYVGGILVALIITHVTGLWLTSPSDVFDVLLFQSPTPFSTWGVLAMWAVFILALLAMFRRKLHIRPRIWRVMHLTLAIVTVAGSTIHALLIEGTMETVSKWTLCLMVSVATIKAAASLINRQR